MENQPLGMPKGSVRALIALAVVSTVMYLVTFQVNIPDQFWTIAIAVIAFYFGTRTNTNADITDRK